MYFKDAWTKAFDPVPAGKKFTLVDGTKVPVEMMIRDSTDFIVVPELSFDQLPPGIKFTVVSIPYQVTTVFHIIIYLCTITDMMMTIFLFCYQFIVYGSAI